MPALLFAFACAPSPCLDPSFPGAEPVEVAAPDPELPPEIRALSGAWAGRWGGARPSRLVVREVGETSAQVTYAIAPFGSGEGPYAAAVLDQDAHVEPDGTLTLGTEADGLRFTPDGDALDGALLAGGRDVAEARFTRCVPGAAPPSVARQALGVAFVVGGFWVGPLVLLVLVARRLRAGVVPISVGVATWLASSAVVTVATPLVAAWLAGGDPARRAFGFGTALAFTAGLVEETARWLAFRFVPRFRAPDGRAAALVAGAAHGATEALVFGLGAIWTAAEAEPRTLALMAARPVFVLAHVGFAAIVAHGVAERDARWWSVAMALHVLVDLVGFALPAVAPGTELVVLVPALALAGWAWSRVDAARRPTP